MSTIAAANRVQAGYWTAASLWTETYPTAGATYCRLNPAYDTSDGSMAAYHKDAGFQFSLSTACIPREATFLMYVYEGPLDQGVPYDYYTDIHVYGQLPTITDPLASTTPNAIHGAYLTAIEQPDFPTGASGEWLYMGTHELTAAPVFTDTWSMDLDASVLARIVQHPDYSGFINLMVRMTPINQSLNAGNNLCDLAAIGTNPGLTVDAETTSYASRRTGLVGPWKAESRCDECPVCGFMTLRETWVMDGYRKHLVCPMCYDPPDPYDKPLVIKPEREGLNEET